MEILAVVMPDGLGSWASWPWRGKVLAVATVVFLVEVALKRLAPRSRVYARWTALFLAVGSVWTAVLLSVVYAIAVGATGVALRLVRSRLHEGWRLDPRPTFWQTCEPNPLGPLAAARHQF